MTREASGLPARGPGHGGDRRGYSWPPFEPGHELSTTHGAYSDRKVRPVAEAIVEAVLAREAMSYLAEPRYAPAVAAWSRAEARVLLLERYLDEHAADASSLDDEGQVLPAAELLERVERRATKLRVRLGLDPKAEADLARSRADAERGLADLEAVRDAGRKVLEERGWDVLDGGHDRDEDEDDEDDEDRGVDDDGAA